MKRTKANTSTMNQALHHAGLGHWAVGHEQLNWLLEIAFPRPVGGFTTNREAPYSPVSPLPTHREAPYSPVSTLPTNREAPYSPVSTLPTHREAPYSPVSTLPTNRETPYRTVSTKPTNREAPYSPVSTKPINREAPYRTVSTKPTNWEAPYSLIFNKLSFHFSYSYLNQNIDVTNLINIKLNLRYPPSPKKTNRGRSNNGLETEIKTQ